jgi:hypothetical protein
MVYLTDVGPDAGPHVYVKGTHRQQAPVQLQGYTDACVHAANAPEQIVTVLGHSGSGFAVDTAGIHKGTVPTGQPRLLLQIQYSLLPTYFYAYEPARYDGTLVIDPYVNRLIARQAGAMGVVSH